MDPNLIKNEEMFTLYYSYRFKYLYFYSVDGTLMEVVELYELENPLKYF